VLAGTAVHRQTDAPQASRPQPDPEPAVAKSSKRAGRGVIARHPNHVWSIDHTIVPTRAGLWVPWSPFSLAQR
jgi:hypothetical protein